MAASSKVAWTVETSQNDPSEGLKEQMAQMVMVELPMSVVAMLEGYRWRSRRSWCG